jgi:very-short-patch-repair endonuclease
MLCFYGCGRESIKQFKNGKWCCSKSKNSCPENRKKIGSRSKGRIPWNKDLTKETHQSIRKQAEKITGRTKENHEGRRKQAEKQSERMIGRTKENHEGRRKQAEKQSEYMKSGGSTHSRKFIKRFSKGELKLREIVKELFPTSEHTYSILNYDVDIALLEYKIAIEYDGHYHFDTEESKEYHKKRQKEIEEKGWKFLRYNIFQKFPTEEQVKEDINKLF